MEQVIKIFNLEERLEVSKILVKNGYQVRQIKIKRDGRSSVDYGLAITDPMDDSLISNRKE